MHVVTHGSSSYQSASWLTVKYTRDNWMHVHDDLMKWKHFPRYWPFVRGIHRSTVNFPHKGQWRGALMFSLICVWINGWVNNREAGDLRRYRVRCDVIVMPQLELAVGNVKCNVFTHESSSFQSAFWLTVKYIKDNWMHVHDDVIKWKHFPRYWPFVRGIHRSTVNSPHKGQWRGALMFSLICAWING